MSSHTACSHKSVLRPGLRGTLLLFLAGSYPHALAATAGSAASATFWSLLIVAIVFAATVGSIVLNLAAIRQWNRNWGLVSGLPILGLMVWSGVILAAKAADPAAHALWTLEIFAWAMLNMIYMVTAMTAKRMFAKRDAENSASAG